MASKSCRHNLGCSPPHRLLTRNLCGHTIHFNYYHKVSTSLLRHADSILTWRNWRSNLKGVLITWFICYRTHSWNICYIMLNNHCSAEGYACHLCIIYLMCFSHDCPASRKLFEIHSRTVMHRLTTGICSKKFVVRRFHCCANIIECTYTNLDIIAYYTPRLYGTAYCS